MQLVQVRNLAGNEYYKTFMELEKRKDGLLKEGLSAKWEIKWEEVKLSKEEVVKNQKIEKSLMLPAQNQILSEMKNIFGYFNHQMVKELNYVANSRAKRYIRSFSQFCNEEIEILDGVFGVY